MELTFAKPITGIDWGVGVIRHPNLTLTAGDVLVAPPRVSYRATTSPDRRSRWYRVFCTEVDAEAATGFARAHPELTQTPALGAFEPLWDRLAPNERVRVIQLLVQRVEYDGRAGTVRVLA